jgi:GDPmannose 4,6-dehydratase
MFACSGILFNHESPRRGFNFVTKKIVNSLYEIKQRHEDVLYLGNLNAKRDWGHAKDYVEAMWLMLQQDNPKDYVIATGQQYSVREFVNRCAPKFGFDIEWQGEGLDEVGIDRTTGRIIIRVDPKYFRPAEVESLLGDSTLARNELGWKPKYTFDKLVEEMCRITYI